MEKNVFLYDKKIHLKNSLKTENKMRKLIVQRVEREVYIDSEELYLL